MHRESASGGVCGYFAARESLRDADLLVMPYQSLLHGGTRESLGVKLRNRIVVFDEGHNVLDGINEMHSLEVGYSELHSCAVALQGYLSKYGKRLSAKNSLRLKNLSSFL